MKKHWSAHLPENACADAVAWCRTQPTPEAAWAACERGDWMLWLLGHTRVKRKKLVLAACECARLALPFTRGPEARVAIETAEAWCRGKATIKQVRAAAAAATAAAAYAAYAYAAAAATAAAVAARFTTLRKCAVIVRRHFPAPPKLAEEFP